VIYDATKAAFVNVVAPGTKTGRTKTAIKVGSATARRSKC